MRAKINTPGVLRLSSLDQSSCSTAFTERNNKFDGDEELIFATASEVNDPFKSSFPKLKLGWGGSGGGGGGDVGGLLKCSELSRLGTHGFCTTLDSKSKMFITT